MIESDCQRSGNAWVQLNERTRLQSSRQTDLEQPLWQGSRLRRKLLLKRTAAILVIGCVEAWLGWAVIAGIQHEMASYTTVVGTVTAQTESPRSRTASCQLDVSYAVDGQPFRGVARTNDFCKDLPSLGSQAKLNVSESDPHDVWLEGVDDASHPDPVVFAVFLVVFPPAMALAMWSALTEYGAARKLVTSGVPWRKIRATVVNGPSGRAGLWLQAEGVSGEPSTFGIFYRFMSPVGPVRKGDIVELSIIAIGQKQALLWRPEIGGVGLVYTNTPPAFVG